jgi:hypothetical protein
VALPNHRNSLSNVAVLQIKFNLFVDGNAEKAIDFWGESVYNFHSNTGGGARIQRENH